MLTAVRAIAPQQRTIAECVLARSILGSFPLALLLAPSCCLSLKMEESRSVEASLCRAERVCCGNRCASSTIGTNRDG